MKILLVVDCVGGVFSYALELSDALHASGTEVVLAVMGAELRPAQRAALGRRPWLTAQARPFRMMWMEDPWRDVRAAGAWLLRLADRHRPDVVHLNDYAHVSLAWPAPVLLVVHACVTSWFAAVRNEEPPPSFARYREVVRNAAARADLVVAPSQAMLRDFTRGNGPCARAAVIRNGIAAGNLSPAPKRDFVLSLGRVWDAAKNVALLGQVAPALSWPVRIAGAVRRPDGGEVHVPGVHLLGDLPRERARALLARAAVYAHPALYEPFGLAPLEAALAGCALVLSDIPTLRELWSGAARFVPPRDPEAWIEALEGLARHPERRRAMAARARRLAAVYSSERMARGYREAYVALRRSAAPAPSRGSLAAR